MPMQAYLLERLGDVQAALGLLCADVESSTQSVIAAILNGTLQAEDSLPRTSTKVHCPTFCQSPEQHSCSTCM